MTNYMTSYWENRWEKTAVDREYAERQLARIALIEMGQIPIQLELFIDRVGAQEVRHE